MAVNRSASNNEVWSRVAGQFAMREVIKQLEGSQYVRGYWDMDSFYAFSGGAPAVYLTYARWLAENGIARASITGKITASNQSLSVRLQLHRHRHADHGCRSDPYSEVGGHADRQQRRLGRQLLLHQKRGYHPGNIIEQPVCRLHGIRFLG